MWMTNKGKAQTKMLSTLTAGRKMYFSVAIKSSLLSHFFSFGLMDALVVPIDVRTPSITAMDNAYNSCSPSITFPFT